jgi:putative ABC transport system ATP-binding protein
LLSGGEKQALTLALTMIYPPKILLLDEHTSALDPVAADNLMALVYNHAKVANITCVAVSHHLGFAEKYGNRVIALKDGHLHKVIDHEEKSQLDQQALLAACY